MEWIEQSQKTYNMIQLVLGGIGAVSLVVAAIGIANTMMMSIYERTKEIGVIKVLGCDLRTIRNMFLLESGFIGFLGGMIGVLISYGIGFIMNNFLGLSQAMMGIDGDISRIPVWLAASAVGFAVLVGMAAGFFPSLRAMHLSPLAAIRNE
jgi:ABC-type antimicrobial peptide transport system permease subunit